MTIKVCLAGATGWAGSALARAIARTPDLQLVAAVSRRQAGRRLGDVLGVRQGVHEGETIVLNGQNNLKDGATVAVVR